DCYGNEQFDEAETFGARGHDLLLSISGARNPARRAHTPRMLVSAPSPKILFVPAEPTLSPVSKIARGNLPIAPSRLHRRCLRLRRHQILRLEFLAPALDLRVVENLAN